MSVKPHTPAEAAGSAVASHPAAIPPPVASKGRLAGVMWLLGLPGVVAVVWALFPVLSAHAALLPLPLWAIVLLSGLQTSVLLALAAVAGAWLAPRVGLQAPALSAWLGGRAVAPALRPQWLPGLCGGVAGAAWLWMLSRLAPEALRPADPASAMPLLVKVLYGGVTEELLVRWGVMTLLLWLAWRIAQRGQGLPGRGVVTISIVLSALMFALGHLPAAQAMGGALTAPVVAFVLVGNTAFGLVAGWLFARRGLEAAIIAHALAHLLSHPLL